MKASLRSSSLLLLGLGAMGLAGCSAADATATGADGEACDETYTIGFSHPVGEADAVKQVKGFAQAHADEVGCVELLLDNTTGSSLESQRQTIESWVTQGIDAIVMQPVDPTAFAGLQQQAQEKGIKWLTYSSEMDGRDGSVGFDNELSGKQIADDVTTWIAATHPEGGISAAVTTLVSVPVYAGRWEEPIAALDEVGVPIVSEQECADQTCGLQIAEDALRENPDLRIFIGLNDSAALGALKAFEQSAISADEVYIAGQDGAIEALEAIEAGGPYKASAAILLDELGASIIDNSIAAITGDGEVDTVTPSVLASLADQAQLDELKELLK
ncbi:sugar ABC transporter substrate-binding protein [Microbacterium trichothecenolyticum]|uniref:Sugar ABC transporter substrate-binding protein n=1 Tax=Microbacterium ureisolvens TaxID=2781186 RepID=A0ABS7I4K7_9MICO|nr:MULTISPECIES: sugar ABC transporter substrate-binding protein [Microbacterium]MBW9111979.1 sugar ABC transporter substrate-binding protein [Microbacterium ureisolvens]MBW9122412.1 sugar ABC transporter substrate-binding protein [Microbacterium trichothecenolyticum]